MPPQPPQQGQDNSLFHVLVFLSSFFIAYFLWRLWHNYIVMFFFKIDILQAKLLNLFLHSPQLLQDINIMENIDPSSVDWAQLTLLNADIGEFMRYPLAGILSILAVYLYHTDITRKYHTAHSMKTLALQEQHNWSSIMPVLKYDLVATEIDKG
ncbi:MAG: phosphoesterase, partial [Legionellaceae bacterium]|nr:phosphoesterase [Legionellaceae bacterium]